MVNNKPEFCYECSCTLTKKVNENEINKGDFYLCDDCVETYKEKTDGHKVYVCAMCDRYYNEDQWGEEKEYCRDCSPDYSAWHDEDCYERV